MSMDEALRIGHRRMFLEAMEMGRQNLEKCWYHDGEEASLVTLADPEAKPALPMTSVPFTMGGVRPTMP